MPRHYLDTTVRRALCAALLLGGLSYAPDAHAQGRSSKTQVQLSFEKASGMSIKDQVDKAAVMLQRMKDHLRRGFELLEKARSEKDIVKLNAINEKLSSMKGLLKISEAAFVALQEAGARRDKETADHEYTKIAIASQKIDALALEAEGAVGDSLHYTGDTRVEVTAEGFAAEGDVGTSGAGADVPAGADSGASGAAAGIAGGSDTQNTPDDGDGDGDGDGDDAVAGTLDENVGTSDGGAGGEDFQYPPVEDVVTPSASPTQ